MTLAEVDPDRLRAAIAEAEASGDIQALGVINAGLRAALAWQPEPYQQPPPGDWWMWVFRAGRGAGKTDAGAHYLNTHMLGPPCDTRAPGGHHAVIVGPTHGDAMSACVNGVSGLRAHNRDVVKVNRKEGTYVVWPNGAEAVVLGAHTENDADRLRAQASNVCCWWFDEAAIARHLQTAIDNVALAGRLGSRPHGIATTTPKANPSFQKLIRMPNVVQTTASSYDNPHLPAFYKRILAQYEGTRLGLQEIHGELLDDYEGALWTRESIDHIIDVPAEVDEVIRRLGLVEIGIGIDPSTWDPDLGDDPGTIGQGIETGIVVVGKDGRPDPHVYVLEDASVRLAAEGWGARAVAEYWKWGANWVAPEVNLGGMVLSVLRLIDQNVSIYRQGKRVGVRAAMGKRARAEPVALLYDQGRAHHLGRFEALESQMCSWDPKEPWSPDRIDVLVWAITALDPTSGGYEGTSLGQMGQAQRMPVR